MELGQLVELLRSAFAADPATADLATLKGAFGAVRRLQAVLDGHSVTLAAAMGRHTVFPEKQMTESAPVSLSEAGRIMARSETVTEIPALAEACERGAVTARHVDAFAKVLKNVSVSVADHLRVDAARLVEQAATMTADEFASLLRREAEGFEPAGDDDARLERQRRAVRLRSFTDSFAMGRWSAHLGSPHVRRARAPVGRARRRVVP